MSTLNKQTQQTSKQTNKELDHAFLSCAIEYLASWFCLTFGSLLLLCRLFVCACSFVCLLVCLLVCFVCLLACVSANSSPWANATTVVFVCLFLYLFVRLFVFDSQYHQCICSSQAAQNILPLRLRKTNKQTNKQIWGWEAAQNILLAGCTAPPWTQSHAS